MTQLSTLPFADSQARTDDATALGLTGRVT